MKKIPQDTNLHRIAASHKLRSNNKTATTNGYNTNDQNKNKKSHPFNTNNTSQDISPLVNNQPLKKQDKEKIRPSLALKNPHDKQTFRREAHKSEISNKHKVTYNKRPKPSSAGKKTQPLRSNENRMPTAKSNNMSFNPHHKPSHEKEHIYRNRSGFRKP